MPEYNPGARLDRTQINDLRYMARGHKGSGRRKMSKPRHIAIARRLRRLRFQRERNT